MIRGTVPESAQRTSFRSEPRERPSSLDRSQNDSLSCGRRHREVR